MPWYLAITKPRQEKRAAQNLENQGIRAFLPIWMVERVRNGQRTHKEEPLFPGYVFVWLELGCPLISKIRSTYGIAKLLSFSTEPVQVHERIVADIQQRIAKVEERVKYQPGQPVELLTGPFKQYQAIFQSYKGADRAIILLQLLNQQNEIVVKLEEID